MSGCTDKNIGKELDRYLLKMLSEEDVERFERHLLECDFCASEVENFIETSTHLLQSKTIQNEVTKMLDADDDSHTARTEETQISKRKKQWYYRVVLAAAAILVVLLLKPWKIELASDKIALAGENRVAVLPIAADLSNEQWLGNAVTSLLLTNLLESDQLNIITTQHLANIIEYLDMQKIKDFDAPLALRIAEKADAEWVIIGNIDRSDPELAINIVLLNTSTGDTVTAEYLTGEVADDLFSLIDKLTDSLETDILRDRNNIRLPEYSVADITTRSPEALSLIHI